MPTGLCETWRCCLTPLRGALGPLLPDSACATEWRSACATCWEQRGSGWATSAPCLTFLLQLAQILWPMSVALRKKTLTTLSFAVQSIDLSMEPTLEVNGFRFFKSKSNPKSKSKYDKLTVSKSKSCSNPNFYHLCSVILPSAKGKITTVQCYLGKKLKLTYALSLVHNIIIMETLETSR